MISNPKSIAQKTRTLIDAYEIDPRDITVDNFGEGANVAQELAYVGIMVNAVNVGDSVDKEEEEYDKVNGDRIYINKRAKAYFGLRHWLRAGAELVQHKIWKDQLSSNRYRTELSGRVKMMGKKEMRKNGIKSPNAYDALMLTFVDGEIIKDRSHQSKEDSFDDDENESFLYPHMNL